MVCRFVSPVLLLLAVAKCESIARLDQTLALLGVRPEANVERNRRLSLATEALSGLETSKCVQNTFFLDWGSSGMKVHKAHAGKHSGVHGAKDMKISGLSALVSEDDLVGVLESLEAKLAKGHEGGAAIATAGFRLEPKRSHTTWERVRKWNEQHRLLANCSLKQSTGCQTLAGAEESHFEMQSMLHHDAIKSGERVAMASCGGASIQVAFSGLPEKELEDCARDLKGFSHKYDKSRVKLGKGKIWFSWLANHYANMASQGTSDYMVGGVDEMRARYDSWLQQKNISKNPCVSPEVVTNFTKSGKCDKIAGKNVPCLINKWGGYITRLNGELNSSRENCRHSVDMFLEEDQMLSTWHKSKSCRALAMETETWRFLTAFSRANQLGADLSKVGKWRDVKPCVKGESKTPFESKKDLIEGETGDYLSSVLLIGFLTKLGLNDSAIVQASAGDVAETAMKRFGLSPGWLTEDQENCTLEKAESKYLRMPPVEVGGAKHGEYRQIVEQSTFAFLGAFLCLLVCGMLAYRSIRAQTQSGTTDRVLE